MILIVKFRINWALCTGEVRKPRLPGDESVSLFLGFTIIGVDDNREIVGVDRQKLDAAEKAVVEICQDSIDPIILIFTEKLRIDDKNLLKIEVPRSLFVHKTPNGYFIRQGSSKREMPTEQLARLFQTRSQATHHRFR